MEQSDATKSYQFKTNTCLPKNARGLEKLKNDLIPRENEEKLSITSVISIISSSDDETGENQCSQEEEMSFDLRKPFTEGWQRECIMREGRMSAVHYISPRKSHRRPTRVRGVEQLQSYLVTMESHLSKDNFSFKLNLLGLDCEKEFMREAKAKDSFTFENSAMDRFFIEDKNNQVKGKQGICHLCSATNIKSEILTI